MTYHRRKIEGCKEAPPTSYLFEGALNLRSGVFFSHTEELPDRGLEGTECHQVSVTAT